MSATDTLIADRYRLGAELGRGGMGVVWEAYDELLHRTVAVKEVHYPAGTDDEERDKLARRTLREARAVAAVEDPHAVRVFDIVEQDGRPWIVMELVRGRTLTDVIRERGALPVDEVVQIGLALTDALAAAHRAGVLHRDVKPSNVLMRDDGRIALTDFGIATVDSDPSDLTTSGQLVGSPAYMAPERARGERPTPAADVWSLGATLWTAAEGQPPYIGENAFATMAKVVTDEPPSCERCKGPLGALVSELMAREPGRRPSVGEARTRLLQVRAADGAATATPTRTQPLPPAFDRTVALQRPAAAPSAPADTPAPAAAPAARPPAARSATPPPAPPPHTPPAAAPPASPRRDRRSAVPVMLGVLAVLVIAGVVAAVLASSGHGRANAKAPSSPKPTTKSSHGASASASPSSSSSAAAPAGWTHYTDPSVGWSVAVPAGWQPQPQGSSTFFRDPAGGRYLQIDTKYPAGPSAKGAWKDQERAFRSSHPNYQRIKLADVSWRNYPDVADWEFTYASGAVTLHAVDRGAVVANRGYGLYFQTHDGQWDSSQQILQQVYASFQPAH